MATADKHVLTAGSKADIPRDLLDQVKRLEDIFTVNQTKLKEITNHFVSELAKGASRAVTGHDATGTR